MPCRAPPARAGQKRAARAICGGRHGGPFGVLGPHPLGKGVVVRAFVPGAERLVVLLAKGKEVEAVAVPECEGLFAAALPKRQDYRLRAEGHGTAWEFDDPFRFGDAAREKAEIGSATHRAVAAEAARKSIVLLKNTGNLLPLATAGLAPAGMILDHLIIGHVAEGPARRLVRQGAGHVGVGIGLGVLQSGEVLPVHAIARGGSAV